MSDRLFAAPEAVKIHSLAIDSFDAPGLGPIGSVAGEALHLSRWPKRREVYRPKDLETHVDLVRICPGMDGRFLDCSREMGAGRGGGGGLRGRGTCRPRCWTPWSGLLAADVPGGAWPRAASRAGSGRCTATRAARRGSTTGGVILAGGLPGHKARLKLMVGLGLGYGPAALREMFEGTGESGMVFHP